MKLANLLDNIATQDRDLSEKKRLCSTHGPANGSWLFGVGMSCVIMQSCIYMG